eukprot:Phypoly_transcript_06573.p1 GENE.Phypoly_transcript_06573~~Phypoly_transcript_06573.p1  ORF type:complete len:400 (+),score=15.16 Phypoly_transcript_06573:148-1347(+)
MSRASVAQMVPAISTSSMEDYDVLSKCGEGTYGCVYKALHKQTRQLVALKKVINVPKEEGSPVEVKYLSQLLAQKNVIHLRDYFWNKGQLCIVFEYMDYDLWRLMTGPNITFSMLQIKCLMKQLLEGLYQCHSTGIMHRDIKPSNLLINSEGILKLADFGLTTSFLTQSNFSNNVVSLYYRPPELLLGSHTYGPEIDMWSVGCILIELITNNYLFAGANDEEQLDLIFRVFGTPSDDSWPGVTQLPGWAGMEKKKKPKYPPQDLNDVFGFLTPEALDLATRLLSLDPKKRISSFDALQHPWFWTSPLPCPPQRLPSNWNFGPSRSSTRKYQSDFPRSRQLCGDMDPPKKSRGATTTRGRRGRGRGAGRTSVRAVPYSPVVYCKPVIPEGSAQRPILIAS